MDTKKIKQIVVNSSNSTIKFSLIDKNFNEDNQLYTIYEIVSEMNTLTTFKTNLIIPNINLSSFLYRNNSNNRFIYYKRRSLAPKIKFNSALKKTIMKLYFLKGKPHLELSFSVTMKLEMW